MTNSIAASCGFRRDRERIGVEILMPNLCWRRESGDEFALISDGMLPSTANVVRLFTHEPVTRSGELNVSPFSIIMRSRLL